MATKKRLPRSRAVFSCSSMSFALIYLSFCLFVCASNAIAQEDFLLANPLEGQDIFRAKGCQQCHAIRGQGGDIAKDLGWHEYYGSAFELAADLWNHSPMMREVMQELKIERPVFTENEMAQLLVYLYYQRYYKKTGDVLNGKRLLSEKRCLDCHSLHGRGGSVAAPLDRLYKYVSPLFMAQTMWNHGPEMRRKMKESSISWPKFSNEEIVDLTNYLRILRRDSQLDQVYLQPGNPKIGKKLFESKGCIRCHAIDGKGGDIGPDFTGSELNHNVTEIAGLMWNHGDKMIEIMEKEKIAWPKFKGREIADLISYLYFIDFMEKPGDPRRGEEIFNAKGCITCHRQTDSVEPIGPDLSLLKSLNSPVQMVQIMWNHAPNMEKRMRELALEWPEFKEDEMQNIFQFLRTLNTGGGF